MKIARQKNNFVSNGNDSDPLAVDANSPNITGRTVMVDTRTRLKKLTIPRADQISTYEI